MERFSTLDHFLLSATLYDTCIEYVTVQHSVDNFSDHDPIFIRLNLSFSRTATTKHIFKPHLSWTRATSDDLHHYQANLSNNLKFISIPLCFVTT